MRLMWICWGWVLALTSCVAVADGAEPQKNSGRPKHADSVLLNRDLTAAKMSNNTFREPEEEVYGTLHDLHVAPARLTIQGAAINGGPQEFELLTYNGRPVGPTIRIRRGETFKIHLKNHLHGRSDVHVAVDQPHGLCTTNLHTHGLHVSPADPADNIFRCIEPDKGDGNGPGEWTYEYTVGKNHPAGTFWYHPHKHGSVAYQLSNGLAGALIVDGADDDDIADLEDIPEIAAARDRVFVFQRFSYSLGKDGVARIDAAAIYTQNPALPTYPRSCESIDMRNTPTPTGANLPVPTTAINGVVMPTIYLAPGEVQRWRMIHAGWDLKLPLIWVDLDGNPTRKVQFRQIAVDGLATGKMTTEPVIDLAPGYRSDVLVQAPGLKPGQREAVYFIDVLPQDAPYTLHGQSEPGTHVAKVVVRGLPRLMKLPDPASLGPCRPFDDIQYDELVAPAFPNGVALLARDSVPSYVVNGRPFLDWMKNPPLIKLNTAQQWTISAVSPPPVTPPDVSSHPFHIHVNPFQVVSHTDDSGVTTPMNVWRDTLFVPQGHSYVIRSRFLDFPGLSVLHCHILDHEDQGMMVPLKFVTDPANPVLPPQDLCAEAGTPKTLKSTSARSPNLRLSDVTGVTRDLSEFRRKLVVLVFFKGVKCFHCAEQLRDLVRQARGSLGPDAEIVAVSSMPVADASAALKTLNVSDGDRFHLLVDEGHRAFRDFGCYADGPLHGLFLIDRGGMICARYTGNEPFDNNSDVVRRVRRIAAEADKVSTTP
jgi:FtsP/CotA-like multicopper oxidase with cupredoxin domain/peroxiredoxin